MERMKKKINNLISGVGTVCSLFNEIAKNYKSLINNLLFIVLSE